MTVYGIAIYNKHTFFVILEPTISLCTGQEVDGLGQFFLLLKISFP